ncbi:protein artichoke-like isoform X1 [Leguminivora glycinivorella]|uniref:protein artichoke-like isoform X1 n=1 Tax=Leguminivora glycinivorella TaxID=1035111 RepID=UPI00200C882E|nr:protein artichoke-like isoform X1 [Leguminivora glycinivorella]XP_047997438.1 protein artichoke-like isoform X1 [Leguminivora glycinivorella]XP_047997439.1 protein artichoke-like isoform X1 [Leguminivora glycinivorella]XP_047997440.1 protein artichoke-like isoform X1 [Leguminivora glycinivorella]
MNSVPSAVYNARKATKIDLSSNTIESLKLEAFTKISGLQSLNLSCNQISDLEVGERTPGSGFSTVQTIDLSYNAISSIPNNYFRQFPDLLHLDLSHNYIKSFDILTFEGITQLQRLYVSDNEITKLGVVFARFEFMKELVLDHNYLTSIEESNFDKMTKLEKLNISSNILASIGDTSFDHLVELKELDLSNNTINTITKNIFQNNTNLQSLDISSNRISKIEPGAFEGKRIEDFKVHNNPITGALIKNTFQGICVDKLDLSSANVTELGPELFEGQFQSLNFSRNSISKIHKSSFSKLESLTELDLSFNHLQDIEFDTSNLNNLSFFYLNNNNIKTVTKDTFKSLTSLKVVDLSNNAIENIEILSFQNLKQLETLNLNNNPLFDVIPPQMFSGLTLTTELDFTNSKIKTIQNNAFNGMESLKTFNSTNSKISVLEVNTFNGTGSIEILDLSYNQIQSFSINNGDIQLVKELYLQYNKLQNVTDQTFSGLNNLSSLTLKGNDLVDIENGAFRDLNNLLKLDLSGNKDLVFNSSIFSNLKSLSVVLLAHVTSRFSFDNVINTTITNLDLSFCDISDINAVKVYQITTLERLNLASNKIRTVDKTSFQNLRDLSWIDLSNNKLYSIQPGSFSDNEDLSILNLTNNFLSSLKFGVFDGLVNLNTLDLSSNTLHSFSANIFHNTPLLRVVHLDNNLIDDVDFVEFTKANIRELYIGGNPVSCSRLTEWKKDNDVPIDVHILRINAKNKIYNRENVDGITCKSKSQITNFDQNNSNDSALAAMLSNSLEEFRVTVERFLNRNDSKIDTDSVGLQKVSASIEQFLEVFNKSETKNNAFLEKLMNINNNTNRVLENMQEYIKLRNVVAVNSQTEKSSVSNDEIERTIIAMLSKEKQSMKTEMKNMFDDWKSNNAVNSKLEAPSGDGGSSDLRSALYFIATCLVVLLGLLVLSLLYAFFKLRNKHAYSNHLSHSRQPISNVMEME